MITEAPLDLDQLKTDFARDGFVLARGLFSPDEVEEVRATFQEINAQRPDRGSPQDGIQDASDPLFHWPRVLQPHRFNATARRYLLHPRAIEVLRALFGEEPVATQSMYYFKPPGARGQAMHQDNLYLMVEPGTCLAAWTAMDRCDRENGCMMVVPKTHESEMICQEKTDPSVSFTPGATRIPNGYKAVEVPMEPGDTLFFNGSLIHGSGPNRSKDRFRRAFIGHYAAGSLDRISHFYQPLVRMDGTDMTVAVNQGGGPCGHDWQGALH